ncbi:tyrosine-type recombinase/integrase [Candidatus Bathyarchaeota archaeon]|nr:tyrosine-type recombinase/integrase [Candidatus Bathyarchaeota archaeon]
MISCPQCGSERLYRDGLRYLSNGKPVQRFLCRACGYRFSQPNVKLNISGKLDKTFNSRSNLLKRSVVNPDFSFEESSNDLSFSIGKDVGSHKITVIGKQLNTFPSYNSKRQVGVSKHEAKNLAKLQPLKTGLAGATTNAEVKGKIVEFAWQLKRDGLTTDTINNYTRILKRLRKRGANLLEPESVKQVISEQQNWSVNTKVMTVRVYSSFLSWLGIPWRKPKYKTSRKQRFLPLEKEIDTLIACCGKKTATILQTLKETGMRIGEALKLEWIEVDFERDTLTVNHAEKHSRNRQFQVSPKLISMLKRLPKENVKDNREVFGGVSKSGATSNFYIQRKKAAIKLHNPRLSRITFHTIRHWYGTMLYQKTKDILYVKKMLGHSCIRNTEIYTHYVEFKKDEWTSRVAKTIKEAGELVSSGFEFVCAFGQEGKLFRKRK